MPTRSADIVAEVRSVLENAARGKGTTPWFLTAYQVLERLPQGLRDRLIAETAMPGSGAGVHHAAASVVKNAMMHHLRAELEIAYLDNVGALFEIAGQQVRGGYPVCGLYRLRSDDGEV